MHDDETPARFAARGRAALHWVALSVAPWALAGGLLVSFTASASNGPQTGFGRAIRLATLEAPADGLVPAATGSLLRDRGFGLPPLDMTVPALREDPKSGSEPASELAVRRDRKGGALVVTASLSRRGLDLFGNTPRPVRLAFLSSRSLLPPTVMMSGKVTAPDWEAARSLEPLAADDATSTKVTSSVQSPAAAAAGSTGPGRGPSGRTPSGATPSVPRAVALSSITPAPAEGVPTAIAAAPVSPLGPAIALTAPSPAARPRYADMIAPAALEREGRCLAEAVYFEARSEPEQGRAAVAQVVLNRVRSGLYPASICGVVYQNRHRHLACQFTFACEGKALRITESEAWDSARRIAADVLEGRTYLAEVGASTHYHADYVQPSWARKLRRMDVIGRHIFYELRPGQT